jgi:predicted transcriptional regulator
MSKAVLISIRPQWCQKIASAEKTIEVRKTRPKLETPFKAYIYCTMPDAKDPHNILELHGADGKIRKANGKVVGEFTCDRIFPFNVFDNGSIQNWLFEHMERSCLTYEELADYIGNGKTGYGWHISGLLIYNQPKGLSEFQRATDPCVFCMERIARECTDCKKFGGNIKRPPQSWCYVEAMKDE